MECVNELDFINLLIDMAYQAGKNGERCPGYAPSETITRCRDCELMDEIEDDGQPCSTDPNGFCAWAVRKQQL